MVKIICYITLPLSFERDRCWGEPLDCWACTGTRPRSREPREKTSIPHGKGRPRVRWVGVQGCGRAGPLQAGEAMPTEALEGRQELAENSNICRELLLRSASERPALSSPFPSLITGPPTSLAHAWRSGLFWSGGNAPSVPRPPLTTVLRTAVHHGPHAPLHRPGNVPDHTPSQPRLRDFSVATHKQVGRSRQPEYDQPTATYSLREGAGSFAAHCTRCWALPQGPAPGPLSCGITHWECGHHLSITRHSLRLEGGHQPSWANVPAVCCPVSSNLSCSNPTRLLL